MAKKRVEPDDAADATVPGWTPELGTRIKSMIDEIGSLEKAGELVGNTAETVARWRDGRARAPFSAILAMAEASGVSLEWVATGRETRGLAEPQAHYETAEPLDVDLQRAIAAAVEAVYRAERITLPPVNLVEITGRKYNEIVTSTTDATERLSMVKLIATQIRNELRAAAAAPGTSKRLA